MIYGEGRWTRHKHGKRKRSGWRKLHIRVNNGFIVAHYLSEDRKTDGEIAPHLIHQVERIRLQPTKHMTKVAYMKLQMIASKIMVKPTFTQELMQSF